jgi:threonine dehydratase
MTTALAPAPAPVADSAFSVCMADVRAAAERIRGRVVRTPTFQSDAMTRATGIETWLKLELLQTTGAYKERGAANRLALLTPEQRERGVIAMSSGNHAQAVARHAALLGVPATIVMPRHTPMTKLSRTAGWGARVISEGDNLDAANALARKLEREEGLTFIHPYDDPAVIAGQGTVGLEMLEDAPELDVLVVPIGGGGLIAGCAVAALALNPNIEVVGVEIEAYAPAYQRLKGLPVSVGGPTIADGAAVQDVGKLTYPIIRDLVSEVLTVSELDTEMALYHLAEGGKVMAEGAGALGVAAMLAHPDRFKGKRVGAVVSGGNVDSRVVANAMLRSLLRSGRLMRLHFSIPDRPGVLADISTRIGDAGGNIIEVLHQRLFAAPSVQTAELEVTVEARAPATPTRFSRP